LFSIEGIILFFLSFFLSAVTKNQFKAASLLLKSGANANASGPEGQTPLIDAVLNNNAKVEHFHLTKNKRKLCL